MAVDQESTFTRLRALYSYSYTDDDGRTVAMVEGDEYILLRKTSSDWWHVLKLNERLPFYVPANYVEVVYVSKAGNESDDDDGEASDDGLLSPGLKKTHDDAAAATKPALPDKPTLRGSPTATCAVVVTPASETAGTGSGNDDGVTQTTAARLAPDASQPQQKKRLSVMPPGEDAASSAPTLTSPKPVIPRAGPVAAAADTVDYVNLAEYQKAAGIGIHAPDVSNKE